MHIAVITLKGRAFRTEKSPDGLRESSEEREEEQEEMLSLGQLLNVVLMM